MRLGFAAALAAFVLCPTLRAQEPVEPPEVVEPGPEVVPAQFTRAVADPPPPVVRVQVRAPAAVAPQSPVKYTVTMANVSGAMAHRVALRHPLPEGATRPTFDPMPDNWDGKAALPKVFEFVWKYDELQPGKSRVVRATYVADASAKQVRAEAFVSFEHGESVITQVLKPRLELTKSAPERALAGEPFAVRVEVANAGGVPVNGVVLLETLPADAEFRGEGERTKNPGQRAWKLGTLQPGQRRGVGYQLTSKAAGEVLAISSLSGEGAVTGEPKETKTQVETAGVDVTLTGPARVEAGGVGEYSATVTNTGTTPLNSVRVRAVVPEDCRATAMSAGGRSGRGELSWDGPPDRDRGPLRPGEKFEVKFKLRGEKAGDKSVRATADAPRAPEKSSEVATRFEGGSLLQGRADIDPGVVPVGETGRLKYVVSNSGDGAAKNVVVTVTLPEGVSVPKLPARATQSGREVMFETADLPPRGEAVYTLEFVGATPSQAVFAFRVAEAAGGRGLRSSKEVAVTRRRD